MRILLVTHRYPPLGVSGVERLSEQSARALKALGHHVTVLTRNDAAAPPLPMLQRSTRHGISLMVLTGGGPLHGRFPKLAPRLELLFERALLEVNPDVVLVSHLINHSPAYVLIARRWQVPVVLELHDFFATCERAHLERISGELCAGPEGGRACATHCFRQWTRPLERWALRTHMFRRAVQHAQALVCPSAFVADYFRSVFGSEMPPLHIIGNGVEPSIPALSRPMPARSHDALHLACIGVVARHKGIHVLLEALRLARLDRVRLTLFGEVYPPYIRSLAEQATRIDGLEFRAYGRFEPSELPILLTDVDLVVIPSLVWETYSIVAREAMACDIPVLASRIGALPEAVRDGENGLLFEPASAVGLAATLAKLDGDRSLLERLRTGIRHTDWVSLEERTAQVEEVLQSVLTWRSQATRVSSELAELTVLRDSFL